MLSVIALVFIVITGGRTVFVGPIKISMHSIQNPLMFLIVALILRKLLTGRFLQGLLCLKWGKLAIEKGIHVLTTPHLRIRAFAGIGILFILSVGVFLANRNVSIKRGLIGQYYDSVDLSGTPVYTTHDKIPALQRARKLFSEMYSIQWTGFLAIPSDGAYRFTTASDDGSALYIADRLVVDNQGPHGLRERSGSVTLEKGFVPITIRYMQKTGAAALQVYWQPPSGSRELLPHTILFPEQPQKSIWFAERTFSGMWAFCTLIWGILGIYALLIVLGRAVFPRIAKFSVKTILQHAALLIFSLLFCLIFLELLLKTGALDDVGIIWIPKKYHAIDYAIEEKNWQFANKNPYRFTDIVRDKQKPQGVYRIAVLGDSFVWGSGLPYKEAWSHKLEQKVIDAYDDIEVMSWGFSGWSTLDEFRFLKNQGIQFDLDCLVLGFVVNDPDMGTYKKKLLQWHKSKNTWYGRFLLSPVRKFFPTAFDFSTSYINTFLMDFLLDGYGHTYWREQLYSPENLQRYERLLSDISDYCHAQNLPLLVVLTPNTHQEFNRRYFEAIIPLLQQADIEYLNLYPVMAEEFKDYAPRELWANPADAHPGPLVTELYAREVFQHLQQKGILSEVQ
jgi:hypothetical protein